MSIGMDARKRLRHLETDSALPPAKRHQNEPSQQSNSQERIRKGEVNKKSGENLATKKRHYVGAGVHYSARERVQKRKAGFNRERYGEKRMKLVNFCEPDQVKDLLKNSVPRQISSLYYYNPSLVEYLKSSSSPFTSVSSMMTLFENAIYCKIKPLQQKIHIKIIPQLFENTGFLEAVRIHLCSLPYKQSLRASAMGFVNQVCVLFEYILSSSHIDLVLAVSKLPVDALYGTTQQLATQAVRFQLLYEKANEILEKRDKVRDTLHNTADITFELENDEIMPTKEELELKTLPDDLPHFIIKGEYSNALQYLNTQYRLLREDLINPLRQAFHKRMSIIEMEAEEGDIQETDTQQATMQEVGHAQIKGEVYGSYKSSEMELEEGEIQETEQIDTQQATMQEVGHAQIKGEVYGSYKSSEMELEEGEIQETEQIDTQQATMQHAQIKGEVYGSYKSSEMELEEGEIQETEQIDTQQATMQHAQIKGEVYGSYKSSEMELEEGEIQETQQIDTQQATMPEVGHAQIKGEVYGSYMSSEFEILFKVPGQRHINWERSKHFKYGDLFCLLNDDLSTILFATIANRNVEGLKKGIVNVNFITKVDVMGLPPMKYRMIESPGFYAAYAPILKHLHALQDKPDSLPFSRYIVKLEKDVKRPQYIADETEYVLNLHTTICNEKHESGTQYPCNTVNVLDKVVWDALPTPNLDDSQKRALHSALTQELSIIQGPPGTGKTYIGLKIVETLLQNRGSWDKDALIIPHPSTIVVVCYTNHALDQFLEGIIKQINVTVPSKTQVRRIGGRCKSKSLEEYNINIFVKKHLRECGIFGFQRSNKQIKCKLDALDDLLKSRFDPDKVRAYTSLIGSDVFSADEFDLSPETKLDLGSAENIACWLGLNPITYKLDDCAVYDDRNTTGENEGDEIFEMFGQQQLHDFFRHFTKVEPLTETRAHEMMQSDGIDPYVRLQLYKYCLKSLKEKLKEQLKMGIEGEERYDIQRRMATIHCLRKADIIGLTTTGAAKYNSLLSEIDAKIVVIEEAAEVLEAHTVASLNRKTQHLILIGDHKQLRPKTSDYTLARDYHLDVSLFERLVSNGLPHVTLQVQHRMRPEISALVSSHIYNNELIDAPSTQTYPPVAGMKHNVFFIDHFEPETPDIQSHSKANDYEAYFLARLCNYLLQQKTYKEEQITVITPYTGQMFNLRDMFTKLEMSNIKITPIDSYQGEENDIILLSLVRSEMPGFVKEVNRICVAISRARHGLYVIGNFSKLFIHKSKLWRELVKCMKHREQFATYLPVKCQNHTDVVTDVHRPEDFDIVSDGGCSLPCSSRLPCRHMCPYKCHPDPEKNLHLEIECKEKCPKRCNQGHKCKKQCYMCKSGCGPCEEMMKKMIPSCCHWQNVPCHCDVKDFICQEPCTKVLECGHQCKAKCGEPHTIDCPELVIKQCPHKHKGKAECYVTNEQYSRRCAVACGKVLMCGDICKGTCGECRQGRLHKSCKEKCTRILTCGHECTSPCAKNCPPCNKPCQVICPHGPCDHICKEQCLPCPYECTRQCIHQQCTRLCGEICDCKPCNEPCPLQLSCGHDCMGLCGEKCPNVCRVCNKDTFNEKVPFIFGTEDLEESSKLRIIMLDCGHMFDVESLDKYYMQSDREEKVQWKQCIRIHCKMPVFKTNRYKNITIEILNDLNQLKVKEMIFTNISICQRRKFQEDLQSMVGTSSLIRHHIAIDRITDRRLQAENIIFSAEKSTKKATSDTETNITSLSLQSTGLEELKLAMNTVKCQTSDFISRLKVYRRDESIAEQVLHDVQAEQHRIQLVSAVINILAQARTKNIQLEKDDQDILDEFMMNFEVRDDRVCNMKMTLVNYTSHLKYLNELKQKYPEISGITQEEKQMIIRALQTKPGSWYKCPKGHFYNIGECGGATETSKCSECKSTIGGSSHTLLSDNTHAGEFDGSQHAAWSTGANMANFDLHDIQ